MRWSWPKCPKMGEEAGLSLWTFFRKIASERRPLNASSRLHIRDSTPSANGHSTRRSALVDGMPSGGRPWGASDAWRVLVHIRRTSRHQTILERRTKKREGSHAKMEHPYRGGRRLLVAAPDHAATSRHRPWVASGWATKGAVARSATAATTPCGWPRGAPRCGLIDPCHGHTYLECSRTF
jgi:hypothetical protein